jgi:hypothetical protein
MNNAHRELTFIQLSALAFQQQQQPRIFMCHRLQLKFHELLIPKDLNAARLIKWADRLVLLLSAVLATDKNV